MKESNHFVQQLRIPFIYSQSERTKESEIPLTSDAQIGVLSWGTLSYYSARLSFAIFIVVLMVKIVLHEFNIQWHHIQLI